MLPCSPSNDMRRKMKKVVGLIAVLFTVVVPVQANGADQKALVIVDSYFDSKVKAPNVSCITITNQVCTDVVTITSPLVENVINHGNAMAEVAKKQNASLPIILLRSVVPSAKSVSDVNAGNFIDALNWVDANSSKIGAVSFSRYFNGTKDCSPATTNTAAYGGVTVADQTIRQLIIKLKTKGIPVFASTGNTFAAKVDYPACITDTVSVGTGSLNLAGSIVSVNAFDSNTDYFGSASVYSYKTPVFGLIPQTTSSATVAVAAQWLTKGNLSTKVVEVTP